MSRVQSWLSEDPPRRSAEIACLLARDRFWQDERRMLIGTHPEMPDAAYVLDLRDELAHALLLVLSRLPMSQRGEFAERFYERAHGRTFMPSFDAHTRLSLAATIVLHVGDVIDFPEAGYERVLDLLRGAAQGDDLGRTPAPAVEEVSRTVTQLRSEPDDVTDPRDVAAVALAEVLAPSSEGVDLQEVLARCAFAAVETWESRRVLDFLLEVDRLFADPTYQPQARR